MRDGVSLHDLTPRRFVPNIFHAQPADYRKAQVTILRSGPQASAVLLPVLK